MRPTARWSCRPAGTRLARGGRAPAGSRPNLRCSVRPGDSRKETGAAARTRVQALEAGAGVRAAEVEAGELEGVAEHEAHAGEHARVGDGRVEQAVRVLLVEDVRQPQRVLALGADGERLARILRGDLVVDAALGLLALLGSHDVLEQPGNGGGGEMAPP